MTDERKYRTEIPNIIDDLGLDPYERTLYVHYKRVCGANGGRCTEGVRATANKTKMSIGKITVARKTLLNRGLIAGDIQHGKDSAVTIPDIWDINTTYYANKKRPDVDGWTVDQLKKWVTNCSPPEQLPLYSSPGEQNSSHSEHHCSPGEQKKEPSKKEPIKKSLPNGNGGKPQQKTEKGSRENAEEPTETLLPNTPETRLLFAKINRNRTAKDRNQAKRFSSLEQKEKCLVAAKRLGYERFSEGIEAGLTSGITDIKGLVNWIAKWGTNPNNSHKEETRPSPQLSAPVDLEKLRKLQSGEL